MPKPADMPVAMSTIGTPSRIGLRPASPLTLISPACAWITAS